MTNDEDLINDDIENTQDDDESKKSSSSKFKPGQSGNMNGRPKGTKNKGLDRSITDEDRAYYGVDSRRFLERALLRASTWEEGIRIAKELRALQHASLQAIQTKTDTTHTITLRWSTPSEIPSNQQELGAAIIEGEILNGKESN